MAASSVIVPTFPNPGVPKEQTSLLEPENVEENIPLEDTPEDIEGDYVPRLKKRMVWIYGIGETGVWCAHVIIVFYLNTFLLEVAKLDPISAGNILLIGQIWDAIVNPIIGSMSDSTESRWGRRRPWLLFAMIPFSLTYLGLWITWPNSDQTSMFIYYLLTLILFNTSSNSITVPFTALTSDLSSTYDHATELTQARMLCNIISGVIISFTHSILITSFSYTHRPHVKNLAKGYWVSGIIWAIVFIIPPILIFIFIREREFFKPDSSAPLTFKEKLMKLGSAWKNVFGTLANKAYLLLTAFFFLSWTAVQLVQNNLLLFTKYVLQKEEQFQWVILLIQMVAASSLFFWSFISRKIGKNWTFMIGCTIWMTIQISIWWINSSTPIYVMYITSFFAGLGISVVFLIPWSMIPDIIDEDEIKKGIRREGVFYSLFVLFQKMGLAIALSASSYLLAGVGYIAPGSSPGQDGNYQPESVLFALKLLVSPVPAGMLLIGLIISWFYPLTRDKIIEVHKALNDRKKQCLDENTQIDDGHQTALLE